MMTILQEVCNILFPLHFNKYHIVQVAKKGRKRGLFFRTYIIIYYFTLANKTIFILTSLYYKGNRGDGGVNGNDDSMLFF